eukprot:365728-Chlamydomonas_euryale.AAC.5
MQQQQQQQQAHSVHVASYSSHDLHTFRPLLQSHVRFSIFWGYPAGSHTIAACWDKLGQWGQAKGD